MSKLPILGILILMAFVVSGYVASAHEDVSVNEPAMSQMDPHVRYYEQHLKSMGVTERDSQATTANRPRVIFL